MLLNETLKKLYTLLLTEDERDSLETELYGMGMVPEDVELSGLELFLSLPYMNVIDCLLWDEVLHRWYRALVQEGNNDPWNVEKHAYFTDNKPNGAFQGVVNQRLGEMVSHLRDLELRDENSLTSKVLTLLSSSSVEMQVQAIELFNALSAEDKLTFTSRLVLHTGPNPCTIHVRDLGHNQFYWPKQFRFCYWMDDYIDWMLAMANDPRWFGSEKLHVQNLMVTDGFTSEMQSQLLAHLLHHPNLTELRLMRSEQNSLSLLLDLQKSGAKGASFSETVQRLGTLTELETSSRYHPILKGFPLEHLTLTGPDSRDRLHLLYAYNIYTTRWASPYWSDSLYLNVNETSFKNLQSLILINASQIEQISIENSRLKDIEITDCKGLTRVTIKDTVNRVTISGCAELWKVDVAKPSFFSLGEDLYNGLGCKVDGTTSNWERQFDRLMELQGKMLGIVNWADASFHNDYFGAYEHFGPKYYVNPVLFMSWFSKQLHGEDSPHPKQVAECDAGSAGYPNNGIYNIEEYSNAYDGCTDAVYDSKCVGFNLDVDSTYTPVNPETEDKIFAIASCLGRHGLINTKNVFWQWSRGPSFDQLFEYIAYELEKEDLWAWIETWPEEIKSAIQKL